MPQAAHQNTPSTLERLSPTADRDGVDLDLAGFFEETRRGYAGNPHLAPLFRQLTGFVLQGGKRLRPRLCLAGYRILTGRYDAPPRPVALAAASLEVFHAFMLVHDDLIDGSVVRRSRATLHEAIRLDGDRPDDPAERKRSGDLALVAGDLLCSLGMRLLGRSGLDDAPLGRAQRLVADMLFETGLGEALDVLYDDCPLEHLSEDQLVESYLRKTARYSVSGPLVLAAQIVGAPGPVVRALDRFGDLLGFGFQVGNDLEALGEDPDFGDHPDLDAGKRTYLLWSTYQRLAGPGRIALVDALAWPVGPARRHRLLGLIAESGAAEACRHRLESARREAIAALREAPIDAHQRRQFVALTDLFRAPKDQDVPSPTLDFALVPADGEAVPASASPLVDA